jgi:hypothetical protein
MTDIDFSHLFKALPDHCLIITPDPPNYTLADANDSYLAVTMKSKEELVGKKLWEAFPENPDDRHSLERQKELSDSLNNVMLTKRTHTLEPFKYDIKCDDGTFEERWWQVENSPILDSDGEVQWILNRPRDVTQLVALKMAAEKKHERAQSIGNFFIDRAFLVGVVVFLQFVSIGIVAMGIAASNRNATKQLKTANDQRLEFKKSNDQQLAELKSGQDLIRDCATPGNDCFEQQIRASSVGAALGSISGSVIVMMECVGPIPIQDRTPARMEACKQKAWDYQMSVVNQAKNTTGKPNG